MELNLDIGYSHHVLYENMHLILPNEGVISLIGNNGSGKSTIFKTIMGLIPPLRGTVPESLISRCAIVSDYVHMPEENKVKDVQVRPTMKDTMRSYMLLSRSSFIKKSGI